jgi:hypothetical protein
MELTIKLIIILIYLSIGLITSSYFYIKLKVQTGEALTELEVFYYFLFWIFDLIIYLFKTIFQFYINFLNYIVDYIKRKKYINER